MPEQAGPGPDTPLNLLLWLISNLEIYYICSPLPLFPFSRVVLLLAYKRSNLRVFLKCIYPQNVLLNAI